METLNGALVRIISDNENYSEWIGRDLLITYSTTNGDGYDSSVYPQLLCDLEDVETGFELPFSLYEWEFEVL